MPTFVIDRHHRIIYWNRACEKFTGFPREEMVGTYRYWLPFYTHEGPPMASLVVEQNFKALETFFGDTNLKPSPDLPGPMRPMSIFPIFVARSAISTIPAHRSTTRRARSRARSRPSWT